MPKIRLSAGLCLDPLTALSLPDTVAGSCKKGLQGSGKGKLEGRRGKKGEKGGGRRWGGEGSGREGKGERGASPNENPGYGSG